MAIWNIKKGSSSQQATPPYTPPAPSGSIGKCVLFQKDGTFVAGVVEKQDGGKYTVKLALPHKDGVMATETELVIDKDLTTDTGISVHDGVIKQWAETAPIHLSGETGKKFLTVTENDIVKDYRDVVIAGYGSTFQGTTSEDRAGDYIKPGAFDDYLEMFKKNPVMLVDHWACTENVVGSWDEIVVDKRGLHLI